VVRAVPFSKGRVAMNKQRVWVFVLSALAVASLGGVPPGDDKKESAAKAPPTQWTPELMLRVKQVGSVQVSPDGKRVAYTVREAVTEGEKSEYRTHIHVANADGSDPLRLTAGEKSCENPRWAPDGEQIAFTSSRSGKTNLWLIRVRGGEAEQLTDVKTGVGSFKWSPDGKQIAYLAADGPTPEEEKGGKEKNDARVVDEDIKMNRLYVLPVAKDPKGKRAARKLTAGNYTIGSMLAASGFDWSPDSQRLVFMHTRTPKADDWTSADLSVVEVASGSVQPLVTTAAAEMVPFYSPDGRWIAYAATDVPVTWAFNWTLHVVPAAGGTPRELAETFDRRPQLVGWSAESTRIYYTEAHGTTTRLAAVPLDGPSADICTGNGVLSDVQLNATRTRIGFTWQNAGKAPEAYASYPDRFEPVQVSRANGDLPPLPLGRTEVLRWKSTDGLEVEGLLTYPVGYEPGQRYPLLLLIHGGPAGVYTQTFAASPALYPVAAFAARGYAVLRANPRGSSGYGKKFRYANYGDWGGGDYQDLMTGVDHVIHRGVADADRLGVMGWSYGGFMTSWVVTQTKRFRAASVGAAVTNLMSFTGTADIPGFVPDYFGGEPWDKLDAYRAHSAMFQVKGVSTPTLIQHGEKDERVPISQGYEFYNALKRQGCTVKMVVYPRTPHGIQEPKLLQDCMNRNLQWMDQYVRGVGTEGSKRGATR
jgi:dipeptidyl aminopeptidase/acylaminoacyl peptidase